MGSSSRIVWVAVAGALAGCGGDGGGACGDFAACGGDLVGSWSAQSVCGQEAVMIDGCSSPVSLTFDGLQVSGTQTYNADHTFSFDATTSGTFTMHWPSACLTVMGFTLSCTQLDTAFMASMGMDDFIQSVSCSMEAQGCSCVATAKPHTDQGSGTYTVMGHTVTEIGSDSSDYCVSGSTLKLKPSAATAMTPSDMSLTATLVFTRK